MEPHDFITNIIVPTLYALEPDVAFSEEAARLLLGTALTESGLYFLVQHPGPALSVYQIEPATHADLWKNYLSYRPSLSAKVRGFAGHRYTGTLIPATELTGNLYYSTAIARLLYFRHLEPLPPLDAQAMAAYYKKIYNTSLGKADPQKIVGNFEKAIKA